VDYKAAVREIGKGAVSPLYICYGTESYLLREFIAFLTQKLVKPELKDFAVSRYDLAETSLDDVLEDARTPPFMAEKKLVIAENALFLTGAKDSAKIEHRPERLLDYRKEPSEFSVLVLIAAADKLDERKKVVKALKDVAISFMPMKPDELLQWVHRTAERKGFKLAEGTADQLILYTNGDLQQLAAEMEKLALYAGPGGTVTGETVDKLVTRGTEQNVFVLVDDIVSLRLSRAFEIFYELLKMKEEPIKILLLIARQFRIMLQVKELSAIGYSQQQIASQIGVPPFAVRAAAEQGKKYDRKRIEEILSQLAELDYQMKTGQVDKVMGLELFLLKLAS
jgi:DNA polymerase-3 subunit delta